MQRNRVLNALSSEERAQIRPYLVHVALKRHEILYPSLTPIQNVYFPTSGMIVLAGHLPSGASVELAAFGNEGLLGALPCLGIQFSMTEAMVEIAGGAFRMPIAQLVQLYLTSQKMRQLVHRHVASLLFQANQHTLCNAFHSLDQRLCNWLLKAESFVHRPTLACTHEDIAHLLGARRSTITLAIKKLQRRSLVRSARGVIEIRDRGALARCACSCHAARISHESELRSVH